MIWQLVIKQLHHSVPESGANIASFVESTHPFTVSTPFPIRLRCCAAAGARRITGAPSDDGLVDSGTLVPSASTTDVNATVGLW